LTLATWPMTLGAVLLRIEDGKTQSITRIRLRPFSKPAHVLEQPFRGERACLDP
jgi:hypothetical protein